MKETEMGNRGSKSDTHTSSVRGGVESVKEQRVDGSSFALSKARVRCTLVAGKSGSW